MNAVEGEYLKHEENHKDCQTKRFRPWLEIGVGKSKPEQSSGFLIKNIFLNEDGRCFVVLKKIFFGLFVSIFFFIFSESALMLPGRCPVLCCTILT